MITTYKLFEAKQVGILYHWTEGLNSLRNILMNDEMESQYVTIYKNTYISFSRNKNLNFEGRPIKIIFDGNNMSNKFKFEPYLYGIGTNKHGIPLLKKEAEERIECDSNRRIKGIKKYIIGIEISLKGDLYYYFTKHNFEFMNTIKEINNMIPDIKIKVVEYDNYL
jgi:hypothetical protein